MVKRFPRVVLAIVGLPLAAFSQDVRVDMSKSIQQIPRVCISVRPASIEPQLDVGALVKEAICKGAGEVMNEYSYIMDNSNRTVDKKGNAKTNTTTYEVFIPTLKGGTRARGILIETAKDGVPVSQDKLDEARRKAGERLEKEEARIDREAVTAKPEPVKNEGMAPLGTYSRMAMNHSVLGVSHVKMAFTIVTFLRRCNLTFLRRETIAGRLTWVFEFIPQADAKFGEGEEYIDQLTGEIAIDAQERIVTRLTGWPRGADRSSAPPAVYQEMTRLKEGIWLPSVKRVNGADYPTLFSKMTSDWSSAFRNYVRFVTEVRDVKVGESPN